MTKNTPQSVPESRKNRLKEVESFQEINRYAAGIDIGANSHFVAIPKGLDKESVKEFKSFTPDLYRLANWLKQCGIKTVAMESTGVYWIPIYEILESEGFDVKLVDARQTKNVTGRKTDVLDCQWIQQLHTFGLLNAAFRPEEQICVLRTYIRQRAVLIKQAGIEIQHMQKALTQMNVQLHHVLSDITGQTGMNIIRAILAGERTPSVLAAFRDYRCKKEGKVIEQALTGNYRVEHLFCLRQALELYDLYQQKIVACDEEIKKELEKFSDKNPPSMKGNPKGKKKPAKNAPRFDLTSYLLSLTGVDLTKIPGINGVNALSLVSEIGLNMSCWKSEKQFSSWLGLCPGNKVSGGKRISGKSKPSANRAASIFRLAASTLSRSDTALGAFLRRMKSRLGAPKAITATAHKLARIVYAMLKEGSEYTELGQAYYEEKYRERAIKNLKRKAESLGFSVSERIEPLVSL